jgi:hypothetical protein
MNTSRKHAERHRKMDKCNFPTPQRHQRHNRQSPQKLEHLYNNRNQGPQNRGPLSPPGCTDLSRWAHAQQTLHNTPFKDYRNKNPETTLHYLTKTEADPRYSPVGNIPLSPKGHGFPGTYPPRESKPPPSHK